MPLFLLIFPPSTTTLQKFFVTGWETHLILLSSLTRRNRGREITFHMRNYDQLWSLPAHEFQTELRSPTHCFSPHQPVESSRGGYPAHALWLVEHSQEPASELSAHKICPLEDKRRTSKSVFLGPAFEGSERAASEHLIVGDSGQSLGFQQMVCKGRHLRWTRQRFLRALLGWKWVDMCVTAKN